MTPTIAEIERLLSELANELEEWIKSHSPDPEKYPDGKLRYERDMALVEEARALLTRMAKEREGYWDHEYAAAIRALKEKP